MTRRNRWAHLLEIQTAEGRSSAALSTRQRRGGVDHEFVVGFFVMRGDEVVLRAVERGAAWEIREGSFTTDSRFFSRWRTKQAAWQWLRLRPGFAGVCRVLHLGRLDVLPEVGYGV